MIKIKEIKTKDYLTKSNLPASDFVINPYVGCLHACKYCYACFMKRFTGHNEDWGSFIDVKLCEQPINLKKIYGKSVCLSSVTDCYNPVEKQYEITRKILKQLCNAESKIDIITKSKLVCRDIDLLKEIKNLQVAISINTINENFKNDMDNASSILERIETLKTLHNNGIKTVLFMSPIFPEITEWKEIIEKTKEYVDVYWFEDLNLRSYYKPIILRYINKKYPHLRRLYYNIYVKNDRSYWEELEKQIDLFCKENNIKYNNYFHHEDIRKNK